jgi:hypothetical protein
VNEKYFTFREKSNGSYSIVHFRWYNRDEAGKSCQTAGFCCCLEERRLTAKRQRPTVGRVLRSKSTKQRETYSCDGKIRLHFYENENIECLVSHLMVHLIPTDKGVTNEVLDFIKEHRSLKAAVVLRLLIIEYSNGRFTEMEHITGQQIRYHWSRLQSEQYKRNEDPFLSSKLLTEEFGCVVLLHLSQPVVAFAFLMPDFQKILDASVENAEYFVDGTCEYYATITEENIFIWWNRDYTNNVSR